MISYSIVVFCALLATCKLTSVASAESCLAVAVAGDFHIKRAGLDNARLDLKTDRTGYQWLAFAAFGDSWWRKGCLSDYPAQIEAEVKAIYGGSPVCRKSGYPADLWWAQYIPGGRASSTHTVVWDSNILKESVKVDPGIAAMQFEVIVRQAMAYNPRQSWFVVHGDDPSVVSEYIAGREPLTVHIAEKIADHYGLPTLNLAKAAAVNGPDGVKSAVSAFVRDVFGSEGMPSKTLTHKPPAPLARGLNAQCHVVTYDDGSIRKSRGWNQGVASPVLSYMSAMKAGNIGDIMEMEFRGTEIGLLDFSSRNGAEYAFRVDGGDWKNVPPLDSAKLAERHLKLASGLAASEALSADSDVVRHTVELKVVKMGEGCIIGFALNGSTADEDAGAGRGIGGLADIDRIYAELHPLSYTPPEGRHDLLPHTMKRLMEGPSLRIVCLGDSIVNDTCSSKFELLLQRMYPKCKVTSVRSVRSATGCWWYKDDNRVEGWVFSHKPDLLLIGGVSQRDDVESIRSVIRQCRAKDPGLEMLVMTPVFGEEGSLGPFGIWNVGWNYDPDKAQHPFRRQLRDMCAEERVAFFDINAPWRQHILDSGKDVGYYHRDRIHSNARGQVILGKLIEKWFSR